MALGLVTGRRVGQGACVHALLPLLDAKLTAVGSLACPCTSIHVQPCPARWHERTRHVLRRRRPACMQLTVVSPAWLADLLFSGSIARGSVFGPKVSLLLGALTQLSPHRRCCLLGCFEVPPCCFSALMLVGVLLLVGLLSGRQPSLFWGSHSAHTEGAASLGVC